MALNATTVWEVRSGGSDSNGGGFDSSIGGGGIDYSQQNSAQYALTSCTSSGAGAVVLNASAATAMLGNVCQIISGTNFTAGFYTIIAVSAGVSFTTDRNCTTGAGSSGVINVGGALASVGKAGAVYVAGNKVWLNGTFAPSSIDVVSAAGSLSLPIVFEGYGSVRGDGSGTRTSNVGALSKTNWAVIGYTSTGRLNEASGSYHIWRYCSFTASVVTGTVSQGTSCVMARCYAANSSTNASACGVLMNTGCSLIDCDVALTSVSGGQAAVNVNASGVAVFGCHLTGGVNVGLLLGSTGVSSVVDCLVYASTIGISVTSSATLLIDGCTVDNNSSDGIKLTSAGANIAKITNTMLTSNGGYGVNCNSSPVYLSNIRYRNNTSGTIGNDPGWASATNFNAVTSGSLSDYNNSGSGDYSLVSTSPAVGAGFPYSRSIGAFQPASGGGAPNYGIRTGGRL